jgi:hypothetical protein
MPTLLLHLTAIESLAAHPGELPGDLVRALEEDLAYARFGAALPDLPLCAGVRGALWACAPGGELPPWARRYHEGAPVGLGLKMAELVAAGALVGTEPGLALLAGYFTHLSLDRVLCAPVERLTERHRRRGESAWQARCRIEWAQALFYHRELHGEDLLGRPRLRASFAVSKSAGLPVRGIGRGMYELVRLASQEVLQEAPTKAEVDGWVRGLYLAGCVLSSPLGRTRALPAGSRLSFHELYRHPGFDFAQQVERGLEQARAVLRRLWPYMTRGTFTPRTRARFLQEFPESALGVSPAPGSHAGERERCSGMPLSE